MAREVWEDSDSDSVSEGEEGEGEARREARGGPENEREREWEETPLLELVEESDIEDCDDDDDEDFMEPSQSQGSDVEMEEVEEESGGRERIVDGNRERRSGKKRVRRVEDEEMSTQRGDRTPGEERGRESDGMSALDALLMDEESELESEEEEEQWMGSVTGMVETDAELELKEDHHIRPLWVCSNRLVLLETFSPLYIPATEFLGTVAEPVSRPQHIHEYRITSYSLYAALSVGQSTEDILDTLNSFSKVVIPPEVVRFIQEATRGVGTVHLLLRDGAYHLESRSESALATLASDRVIAHTHYLTRCDQSLLEQEEAEEEERRRKRKRKNPDKDWRDGGPGWPGWTAPVSGVTDTTRESERRREGRGIESNTEEVTDLTGSGESGDSGDEMESERGREGGGEREEEEAEEAVKEAEFGVRNLMDTVTGMQVKVFSFEVHKKRLQAVLDRSKALGFPLLQEYEYEERERDRGTGAVHREGPKRLEADLKPSTRLRGYQEKSLARMFNDGRARSGIVVLPCGAGKTLVGIAAACTIRQRTLVITTVEVAVQQWRSQFKLWTTIKEDDITMFTAKSASEKRIVSPHEPLSLPPSFSLAVS